MVNIGAFQAFSEDVFNCDSSMRGLVTISKWKVILIFAGLILLASSMLYTNYLARKLSEGEFNKMQMLTLAYQEMNELDESMDPEALNEDIPLASEIIINNDDIPMIQTDLNDNIFWGRGFSPEIDTSMERLQEQLDKIKKKGPEPIINNFSSSPFKIYYTDSRLLRLLTFFPIFQLLLLIAFITLGFIGFSATKRAEQNRVWVGMAKETAHQLGTPISGILAWIEHLKVNDSGENREIITELSRDVERLELIADRFSKIGSAPKLEKLDLLEELEQARDYMQKRASRKVIFEFPALTEEPVYANLNSHLFQWVLENLMRNSLDAMEGKGKISLVLEEHGGNLILDLSDTGKGIPPKMVSQVFDPGFTTKKRGWGLGLSLAKRIIENYHNGKISVKESKPGEGTTFRIILPAS